MGRMEKALHEALGNVPRLLLMQFLSGRLKEQGLEPNSDLLEALVDHALSGSTGLFTWEDGKSPAGAARNVELVMSDQDAEEFSNSITHFVQDSLPLVVERVTKHAAKDLLRTLKKGWAEQHAYDLSLRNAFRVRLEGRWSNAFGLLRMLLTISREIGGEEHKRLRKSRARKDLVLRSVMVRLHARACQVADEITTLMENGFADGAMARWRTLYEIEVVSTLIVEGGESLAQRYIDHDAVESKSALDEYERCHQALGFKPISPRERQRIESAYAAAIAKYGANFGKPNGWSTEFLKKKGKATFKDLETRAQRGPTRTYYKMASYPVHADIKGLTFRLGVLNQEPMVLTGASNAGIDEPGQNTAITLSQITSLLLDYRRSTLEIIVHTLALLLLRDETVSAFARAARRLSRDHMELVKMRA